MPFIPQGDSWTFEEKVRLTTEMLTELVNKPNDYDALIAYLRQSGCPVDLYGVNYETAERVDLLDAIDFFAGENNIPYTIDWDDHTYYYVRPSGFPSTPSDVASQMPDPEDGTENGV